METSIIAIGFSLGLQNKKWYLHSRHIQDAAMLIALNKNFNIFFPQPTTNTERRNIALHYARLYFFRREIQ